MNKPKTIQSIEEAEERLQHSAYPKTAPANSFQESLRAQLLEKRLEKPAQPFVFSGIFWKALVPAATALTIAILFVIPSFLQTTDVQNIPKETKEEPAVQIEPIAPKKSPERKINPPSAAKKQEPAEKPATPTPTAAQPIEDDELPPEPEGEEEAEAMEEAADEPESDDGAALQEDSARPQNAFQTGVSSVTVPKPMIRLTRIYTDIDGDTNIQEGETVIVTFSIVAEDSVLPTGALELIDYIPEGFTFDAVRSPAAASIAGQTITFRIERSDQPFRYFVTAARAGEYTVPSAQIRSLEYPEINIFSDQTAVKIQSL